MERKIVLAIFAPALVALAMRIALFVLALPIFGIAFIEPSFQYDAEELAALIRAGEVVSFPTETVYGLGADGLNPEAVAKIFAAECKKTRTRRA